jgi:hypothetical protein
MKYEIDKNIYYYGNHFKNNYEIRDTLRQFLSPLIKLFLVVPGIAHKSDRNTSTIISTAGSSFNQELRKKGYRVQFPDFSKNHIPYYFGNLNSLWKYENLKRTFRRGRLTDILSNDFIKRVIVYKNVLKRLIIKQNVAALFVANDMAFLEKLLIQIFKELGKPSIVFLHGWPSRYNSIDDNRADYLAVWGEKIKANYVNAGVDGTKIIVTGHPDYSAITCNSLRNTHDDILIITNTITQTPENSDRLILQDRGMLIYYLLSIQQVLKTMGIKSVRYRPHPSENAQWYERNIDTSFFKLDWDNLTHSLRRSTLIIGPISTVILDSVKAGVNYVVYEPLRNNLTVKNFELCPPFDKSEDCLTVANNENDLYNVLKEKRQLNLSMLLGYAGTRWDITKIMKIIE